MKEAHHDNARFYLKNASVKDALPIHGKQDGKHEQLRKKRKKIVFEEKKMKSSED